ncbi:hypothetical protein [Saccharopolyspora phatthalungensis]|uniref:Uncharacterized protein n=1 Tax=Saccharopolyspora phatthalungensis TaxID=664693 RepID=A0A840QBK9_9PSEU|nr:hypothetical protein [Saccharopolyspora phatthalungensis]MBB5155939.1 hypothetical protein [Saccharopolyspora phatthalungensis]
MTTTTTPPATSTAPQWLRDLAAARTRYEELVGWPVTVEVQPRRLTVPVGEVLDALTMPAPLGHAVQSELRLMMLAGPVIAGPGHDWWTFLTEPTDASRPEVPAELHRWKLRPTPRGAHVILPALATTEDKTPQWIGSPRSHTALPPWHAVIGATRRALSHLDSGTNP